MMNNDPDRAAVAAKQDQLEADLRVLRTLMEPEPTLGEVLFELRAIKGLLQELVNLQRLGN